MAKFLFFPYSNQLGSTVPSITLAKLLQRHGHQVVYASNGKFTQVLVDKGFDVVPINEISYLQYRRHVDQNNVDFYSESLIHHFVDVELDLIQKVKPDVIVSNNRPTIKLSAQIAQKKMVSIVIPSLTRYYDSPYYIPENHFLNTLYPFGDSNQLIPPSVRKFAFLKTMKHWSRHFTPVCKYYQLPVLKDYLSVYEGDVTLINQSPGLTPFKNLPSNYYFLEQTLDSTFGASHAWVDHLKQDKAQGRKIVYISMGSSALKSFPLVIHALEELLEQNPNIVLVSNHTGLSTQLKKSPRHYSEKFIQSKEILPLADIVITHGGINTLTECLLNGKIILGIPEQGEQLWNLKYAESMGLGKVLSKFKLEKNPKLILPALTELLSTDKYHHNMKTFLENREKNRHSFHTENDIYQAVLELL
jgi:UDP:flavonoid glycosyltransferase YjiC (YdhE family)